MQVRVNVTRRGETRGVRSMDDGWMEVIPIQERKRQNFQKKKKSSDEL